MDKQQTRRRSARVSISSIVNCESADLAKFGGEAYNLSTGGIALKTNYPIRVREQFAAELLVPDEDSPIRVEGKVVWRRFHGDSPGQEQTLFTAGVSFLDLNEPSLTIIRDYIQSSTTSLVA
jgi:c-di-GMP-binding flagellar brake protein YcgR